MQRMSQSNHSNSNELLIAALNQRTQAIAQISNGITNFAKESAEAADQKRSAYSAQNNYSREGEPQSYFGSDGTKYTKVNNTLFIEYTDGRIGKCNIYNGDYHCN